MFSDISVNVVNTKAVIRARIGYMWYASASTAIDFLKSTIVCSALARRRVREVDVLGSPQELLSGSLVRL